MNDKVLDPSALVPMDLFEGDFPLRVDLVYAGPRSLFGTLYRPEARLWLHEDMAAIVLLASRLLYESYRQRLVLFDGLRTVEAQQMMSESAVVRAHPHWTQGEDRVLSPPGAGGHPRGMAIDLSLESDKGRPADMGTGFDDMPEGGSGPDVNRAHRRYPHLPYGATENRRRLENAMLRAAESLRMKIVPLPVEWWDFRFPADVSGSYAPLSDAQLPPQMRMATVDSGPATLPDFSDAHFLAKKDGMLARLDGVLATAG